MDSAVMNGEVLEGPHPHAAMTKINHIDMCMHQTESHSLGRV